MRSFCGCPERKRTRDCEEPVAWKIVNFNRFTKITVQITGLQKIMIQDDKCGKYDQKIFTKVAQSKTNKYNPSNKS